MDLSLEVDLPRKWGRPIATDVSSRLLFPPTISASETGRFRRGRTWRDRNKGRPPRGAFIILEQFFGTINLGNIEWTLNSSSSSSILSPPPLMVQNSFQSICPAGKAAESSSAHVSRNTFTGLSLQQPPWVPLLLDVKVSISELFRSVKTAQIKFVQ